MRVMLALCMFLISFSAFADDSMSPETVDGTTLINTEQAREFFDRGVVFVDVRKKATWEAGRIPGAVHLYLKTDFTEDALSKVANKDDEVVIYCHGPKCKLTAAACEKAVGWGYSKIYYYREGYPVWNEAGNPTE